MAKAEPRPSRAESGTATDDIDAGKRVLRAEADGIAAAADLLDARFARAVDLLSAVAGRVVVSGMGKNGHIAGKLAATLSSTGTPAFYVHPAEASHGDLGMIKTDDAVLLMSNSGETPELADLIAYTRRFGIPLVAIVGRADSTLAEQSDVAILLPPMEEACPMGLAPTTTTTVSLAIGDALAVALLERKGFTADQFHVFHPGGKLGKSLVRVSEIMRDGDAVPTVNETAAMTSAVEAMTKGSLGCVGVVDDTGGLVGVVTDGDLRRHLSDDLLNRRLSEIMTPKPQVIDAQAMAAEALARMNQGERPFTVLFVTTGGGHRPVGILHMHDLLRAGIY